MNDKQWLLNNINKSYSLLKRETYYEHIDLFLRESIVKFENEDVEKGIQEINDFLVDQKLESPWFQNELESIGVNFLPKKIGPKNNNGNNNGGEKYFISNLRTQDKYQVEEINYFIKANLSVYIFSMLWSMLVGPYLDKELSDDCFGNRLDFDRENLIITNNYRLFKLYIRQYNRWRDDAIQTGLDLLEKQNDVLLIALDFKQCFYRLPINWEDIQSIIKENVPNDYIHFFQFLTRILEQISITYFNKTKEYLKNTHKSINSTERIIGIPVGLPSSRILANWELRRFDNTIKNKLRPIYYGRYVDDVLIVINNPEQKIVEEGINKILQEYFEENGILEKSGDYYKVNGFDDLYIQNSKIIIHYYNHLHSWAGLKEFKEELRQKASEFRFLPEEDQYKDLVDEAYDIQYDGSMYRFRSVIGISENATKLSHYLFKQQLKFWLCNDNLRDKTIDEIFRFYRGKNIFDYCRLWERVFTLFIVSQKYHNFYQFARDLEKTIQKLYFKDDTEITEKIIEDCRHYKKIAMSMAIGYLGEIITKEQTSPHFYSLVKHEIDGTENSDLEEIKISPISLPYQLRKCMFLRHQNMFWPLLDYTNFSGNLTKLDWKVLGNQIKIDEQKIKDSTRFLQLDEFILFKFLRNILTIDENFDPNSGKQIIDDLKFIHCQEFLSQKEEPGNKESDQTDKYIKEIIANNINIELIEKVKLFTSFAPDNQKKKQFRLGIVNMKVNAEDIEASYNPRKAPNNTYKRQLTLFNLINQGIKEPSCDLIIFPEVSIPFSWIPFMVNQARRSNIGIIFGVEHVVKYPYALNLVATVLPFKNQNQFNSVYLSLRLKNHYSPKEVHELSLFNLTRPPYGYLYEKFSWRGVVFPVYNCYELTDIRHRGLFRSEIDLIVAVEYNPDINYFSNIIEAAARDIHCYAVQANSSDYGDSRVISPQITEKMNIIRVKGGDNAVLLKTTLDIETLRDFQSREYSPNHNDFKPTPAGFDHEEARKRK